MGGISVLLLMGILSFMFFTFLAIFLAIIIYVVISYIFESISIMCISRNLQYKLPGTSWIPFYNKYLLGKIAGNKMLGSILALSNITTVCTGIYSYCQIELNNIAFCIFLFSAFAGFIIDIVIVHKIYKNVTNKYGDILTVLSVLSLGFLRPVFLFLIRNKVQKENIMKIK